jgi:hypothetical protein
MSDFVLGIILHILNIKGKHPNILKEVFLHSIFFFFFLGGKRLVIPHDTVVTGILDMYPGKHDLHFLVGVELLPHAFVNIPDEKMHIGVLLLIFIIYFKYFKFYSCF